MNSTNSQGGVENYSTGLPPLVTVTFCGYGPGERFWAFNKMGSARSPLGRTHGLKFWKLLGTGKGSGFDLKPNFSRYGLFAVWETDGAADEFFASSSLMADYRRHAEEVWTVRLRAFQVKGEWSGRNPFLPLLSPAPPGGPVAVLTRATVRWSRLVAFWRAVPATSRALDAAPGLLASVGTGELPFTHPATFSIWRSEADMQAYAYSTAEHREVIRRKTRDGWYREELFARFVPTASEGKWDGHDPLAGLCAATPSARAAGGMTR